MRSSFFSLGTYLPGKKKVWSHFSDFQENGDRFFAPVNWKTTIRSPVTKRKNVFMDYYTVFFRKKLLRLNPFKPNFFYCSLHPLQAATHNFKWLKMYVICEI